MRLYGRLAIHERVTELHLEESSFLRQPLQVGPAPTRGVAAPPRQPFQNVSLLETPLPSDFYGRQLPALRPQADGSGMDA